MKLFQDAGLLTTYQERKVLKESAWILRYDNPQSAHHVERYDGWFCPESTVSTSEQSGGRRNIQWVQVLRVLEVTSARAILHWGDTTVGSRLGNNERPLNSLSVQAQHQMAAKHLNRHAFVFSVGLTYIWRPASSRFCYFHYPSPPRLPVDTGKTPPGCSKLGTAPEYTSFLPSPRKCRKRYEYQ